MAQETVEFLSWLIPFKNLLWVIIGFVGQVLFDWRKSKPPVSAIIAGLIFCLAMYGAIKTFTPVDWSDWPYFIGGMFVTRTYNALVRLFNVNTEGMEQWVKEWWKKK